MSCIYIVTDQKICTKGGLISINYQIKDNIFTCNYTRVSMIIWFYEQLTKISPVDFLVSKSGWTLSHSNQKYQK